MSLASRTKLSLLGTMLTAGTALFTLGQHSFTVSSITVPGPDAAPAGQVRTAIITGQPCIHDDKEEAQPRKLLAQSLESSNSASEFLIATVPDPQTTNLALFFDRVLESLTWAIDDSLYNFERYWIPWRTKADPELLSLADRKCREKELNEQHDQPGVLVFRRRDNAAPRPLLTVFLVSETPSGGISKKALSYAVNYINTRSNSELKIVGPTFSGSLQPLAIYLNGLLSDKEFLAKRPDVAVRLVSGTLSSAQSICRFRASLGRFQAKVKDRYVIENDERAGKLFFDFISKEWYRPEESGLLSEDDTAYGNVAEQIIREVNREGKKQAASPGEARSTADQPGAGPFCKEDDRALARSEQDKLHAWLSVRYPREISRLRNAPQSAAPTDTKKSSDSVVEGVSQDLKESSGDSAGPLSGDNVPAFSKIQSPASQQAALLQISSALKREHVEYTGIMATDVLDSLFLARFLRQSAPDIRIFTFDADLLFPRENQTAPLEGVLSVTTYPLISRNQHWTAAELAGGIPRRVPFTSQSAEGIYNACRYLLEGQIENWDTSRRGELLLEYRRPESAITSCTSKTHHPPLWLTVVGRRGYWPVAILDDEDKINPASSLLWLQDGQTETPREALHPESPSGGWYLCVEIVVLLALFHCIYVLRVIARKNPPQNSNHNGLLKKVLAFAGESIDTLSGIFRSYPKELISDYESPFLLIATAVFACALYFLVESARQFEGEPHTVPLLFVAAVFAVFIFLLAVGVRLVILFQTSAQSETKAYQCLVFPTIILTGSFCVVITTIIAHQRFLMGYFFAYRSLNVTTGVSPALPVLILAVAYFYWAWVQLRREQLSRNRRLYVNKREEMRTANPSIPIKDAVGPATYIEGIEKCNRSILSAPVLRPALILTVVWFCALAPWRTVRSFEGHPYDWLYRGILTLLFYMTSVCYTHLIYCWRQFQRFLQELERSPVRAAFSRLRKQITWVPLIAKMPEHRYLLTTLSYETLWAINTFQKDAAKQDWQQKRDAIQSDIDQVSKSVPIKGDLKPGDYATLQVHLDNIAYEFISWLQKDSWARGGSESLEREREQFKKGEEIAEEKQLQILEEEFVALRYLVFMRYIFRHLRNLLGFVIAGFIAIVLSLNSYPFESQRWIGLITFLSFLTFGIGIAMVFAEMDRDAILSRLTDTTANELSRNFVFRLLQYGTLPLLTVLSAQFPWIQKTVISALQPALEALH